MDGSGTTDERGHPVAHCQDAPGGGDDVEPVAEHQDQQQNRERVEQDAGRKSSSHFRRAVQPRAADTRQDVPVERQRRRGEDRRLPPLEIAQQQREPAHRHVDDLAGVLGRARAQGQDLVCRRTRQ
jgi:hypothetical protein